LGAGDADAVQYLDHLGCVAELARGDQHGHRAAAAFTGEVDLARQAAPGQSESLIAAVVPGRRSFFGMRGFFLRAPAACWWARQEVESTLTMLQSIRPARSASAWTARRILSQVPLRMTTERRVIGEANLSEGDVGGY
jgi:hypothetical protein